VDVFARCFKKVERAIEHLKTLDEAAERFGKEHGDPGVRVTIEPNSQGTRCLVKVEETPVYPEVEWGIMMGDAVHCLRSALDQLVSSLCTEAPSRRTTFPIWGREKDWIIEAPGQIWSLPSKYVAIVKEAQPYHRGDQAHSHPLAVLHELWNLDKHRAIPSTALVPTRVEIAVDEERSYGLASWTKFKTHPGRPLVKGTVLADCGFTLTSPDADAKMEVNTHMSVDVGFGQLARASSISHKPVGQTFHDLIIPAVFGMIVAAMGAHNVTP